MIQIASEPSDPHGNFLVAMLLQEQHRMSAVDRFAQQSFQRDATAYRALLPLTPVGPGQQYAFEVDLDTCSGCKSCVAACHNLNGLEDQELWRNVGLLVGGTIESPSLQHVTAACHHCVEPACLSGCPVNAYEKDPVTGIVIHLDDQCIGCQYCVFMCPYDVPRYSPSKGIVRKCDMCHDRLSVGEAPTCVQSCPNQAIRITVVNQEDVIAAGESSQLVPGAPEHSLTYPTTTYKTERSLPRNLLPVDYYRVKPQHSHTPLVVMLVLTQLALGAFAVGQCLVHGIWPGQASLAGRIPPQLMSAHFAAGLLFGMLGLLAAVFHLGRPHLAYRALLGIRTSWLSREIVAFGLFAKLAAAYTICSFLKTKFSIAERLSDSLGWATVITGVLAVGCSVVLYVQTKRPLWSASRTSLLFFLTALVLGIPTALLVSLAASFCFSGLSTETVMHLYGRSLCQTMFVVCVAKLAVESSLLLHLRDRSFNPHRQAAILLLGDLKPQALVRLVCGLLGGVILPAALIGTVGESAEVDASAGWFVGGLAFLAFACLLAGELIERRLFFATSVARRMPGSPN